MEESRGKDMEVKEIKTVLPNDKDGKCGYINSLSGGTVALNVDVTIGEHYVFSIYIKSTKETKIAVNGTDYPVSVEWTRVIHRYVPQNKVLTVAFSGGEFYIYKAQVEKGIIATPWMLNENDRARDSETLKNWCYEQDMTYINGGAIATGTVTAKQIDVSNLFAQEIEATGTIKGAKIVGASGEFTKAFTSQIKMLDDYEGLLGIYSDSIMAAMRKDDSVAGIGIDKNGLRLWNLAYVNGRTYDTGWVDVPCGSGISGYSENVKIRRVGNVVHLRGVVKNASKLTTMSNLLILPSDDFKPSSTENILCGRKDFNYLIRVYSDGNVGIESNTEIGQNSWLPINCTWLVD